MPKSKSNSDLIDNEFITEDDLDNFEDGGGDGKQEEELGAPPMQEVVRPDNLSGDKKPEPKEDPILVEIKDDTPPEDKGKWVAGDEDPSLPTQEDLEQIKKRPIRQRIEELSARVHAERRAREEQKRQFDEALAFARGLLRENNELKGVLENGEKVLYEEHKARLDSQLQRAKTAYREASEAGDTNATIAAQEEIARAVAQIERMNGQRMTKLPRASEDALKRYEQPVQEQAPAVSDLARQWGEKNKWFWEDLPMRSYAMAMHTQLVNSEGLKADTPEYYKRVDAEMRKRFPERFERSNQPQRRNSPVAPVSRTGNGAVKVTLTESQARLARRLGVTPEQYARQVLKEQQNGDREYTHTKSR